MTTQNTIIQAPYKCQNSLAWFEACKVHDHGICGFGVGGSLVPSSQMLCSVPHQACGGGEPWKPLCESTNLTTTPHLFPRAPTCVSWLFPRVLSPDTNTLRFTFQYTVFKGEVMNVAVDPLFDIHRVGSGQLCKTWVVHAGHSSPQRQTGAW